MSALEKVKELATGPKAPWLLGGVAAVAVYFWWTRAPDPDVDPGTAGGAWEPGEPATGTAGGGGWTWTGEHDNAGVINPRVPPTIPAPPNTPGDPAPTDPTPTDPTAPQSNAEWINRAISYLMSRLVTAEFAQSALAKAAGGEPMSIAEMAAVSLAMQALGPPPDGFPAMNAAPLPPPPGIPTVPPPPTDPTTPPTDPTDPVDPPPVDPPPATPVGKMLALTGKFINSKAYGTSQVLDKVARDHGLPAILANPTDPKTRKVVNQTAIQRIWWAPQNAALRARYGNDWTKLRMGDQIWVPTA